MLNLSDTNFEMTITRATACDVGLDHAHHWARDARHQPAGPRPAEPRVVTAPSTVLHDDIHYSTAS